MSLEPAFLIGFSVLFIGLGLTLLIGRRRVAANATAAGIKGFKTPSAVAACGLLFVAFGIITPGFLLIMARAT